VIYNIRSDVRSGERVAEDKQVQIIEEIIGIVSGARCGVNKATQSRNQANIDIGCTVSGMKAKKQDRHDYFGQFWTGSNSESDFPFHMKGSLGMKCLVVLFQEHIGTLEGMSGSK